jgi:hypothetical protein
MPAPYQWNVFRGSDAIAQGELTRNQLRSSAWRRLFHDVYADSRLPLDHALRCSGALLIAPPEAVISGRSAAALHGVGFAAGPFDPVDLTLPLASRFGPVRGLRIHHADLVTGVLGGPHRGLRVLDPVATAWDLATRLDVEAAVTVVDALLAGPLLTLDDLRRCLVARSGERGFRPAVTVFDLVDGRAGSPAESIVRVRLALAGLPRPVPRYPVPVRGHIVHPALAWPEHGVALEYERAELPDDAGWLVVRATHQQVTHDFDALLRSVTSALGLLRGAVRQYST